MKTSDDLRYEAARAVIFVFLLFAVAEVAAPYFGVKFSDPLLFATFIVNIMSRIAIPKVTRRLILVVKTEDFPRVMNFIVKNESQTPKVLVAKDADEAVEILKNNPEKLGVKDQVQQLISRDPK